MGKSCRVYFGKIFVCSVIFLWLGLLCRYSSLKLAMRSSEITRSSSKRDVAVNTIERSSDRTWQTRHPCGGKKIFPEKSVNRGFLFSLSLDWLIRVKLWPVILARLDKCNGTSFFFWFVLWNTLILLESSLQENVLVCAYVVFASLLLQNNQ